MSSLQRLLKRRPASTDELLEALDRRQASKILLGRIAIRLRMLTKKQVLTILANQETTPERRFGEIAVDLGYLTPGDVHYLLRLQRDRLPTLDDTLASVQGEEADRNAA